MARRPLLALSGHCLLVVRYWRKAGLAPQIIAAYFSNMRRAITLILYLALVVAGLYLNLWLYQTRTGARFSVLMVGCFLVLFGGYMLWTYFLSPNREKR